MHPDWLLTDDPLRRALALAAMILPLVFILFSRRAGWAGKLLWGLFSQLPWVYLAVLVWVWRERYAPEQGVMPAADTIGWWLMAFPWGVYLLYRATREWFPGESLTRERER